MINWSKNALRRILNWIEGILSTEGRSSILEPRRGILRPLENPRLFSFEVIIEKIENVDKKDIQISYKAYDMEGIWETPGQWDYYWTDHSDRFFILFRAFKWGENPRVEFTITAPCNSKVGVLYLKDEI